MTTEQDAYRIALEVRALLVPIIKDLVERLDRIERTQQDIVLSLVNRVAAQSDLLSRRAEKPV
jgi:hypothetical protein